MILEMIKDIIWVRSNRSLFQMFFLNSHSKSQKKYLNQDFEGIHCWDMAAGALIVSEAGGVVRFVFISSLYLSSFPHYICIHFPIIFVFISALYLSSFPHYICLALLAVVSIFFTITCARISLHRFWIPLAVTLT